MNKLQLSGVYGEFGGNISVGYDMASGSDFTAINRMVMENNADFDVKKMREMLRTAQGRMIANSSFGAYGRFYVGPMYTERQHAIRMSLSEIAGEFPFPDYYPTGLAVLTQAGLQIASAFPEPSAWREFIETKGPVDDGVSWLFRKSLVSMAITQVLKS